jgi:hypothetical protein
MNTMTSFVKASSSSNIAMEIDFYEEEQKLSSVDEHSIIAGQGVDLSAVGAVFEGGSRKFLSLEVVSDGCSDFGVQVSVDHESKIIQISECFSFAEFRTLEAHDILNAKYYSDSVAMLDVRAGAVFATYFEGNITVFCSTGASIGDKEIEVVVLPHHQFRPIQYLLLKAFDRQEACMNGEAEYTKGDYFYDLVV